MDDDGRIGEPADDTKGYCTQLCCAEVLPCGTCLCEAQPAAREKDCHVSMQEHVMVENGS